jgi:hypothetical protein
MNNFVNIAPLADKDFDILAIEFRHEKQKKLLSS